jgi:hypothetical protein
MKLSELKPCDNCGKIPQAISYILRSSMIFPNPTAARQTLGLATIFGGNLGLAEIFSPEPEVMKIAGDENPELWNEILLCQNCYMSAINIAEIVEMK